jgi:hypothetical protein
VVIAVLVFLGVVFMVVDLSPDLGHLDVRLLSGTAGGGYHVISTRLARRAAAEHGQITVRISRGSVENLETLAAASKSCEAHFALIQDGIPPPEKSRLELIGRLPKSESLFFLGKNADALTQFVQLRGLRIGVGPEKSGTEQVTRQILESEDFQRLGLRLSNHTPAAQLDLLEGGELDLGAFVIDEDADFIRDALRRRGLQLASFEHLDVVARRSPFLWHGRIGAGQFDPIQLLPPQDHRVLRVDTLVVSNGCASYSQTIALLTLLNREFPRFVEHNRDRGQSSLYPTAEAARSFFENRGPTFAEVHVPWLVNLAPPSNWVYIVMTISVLLNVMAAGHRFQLWRIDVARVNLEQRVFAILGESLTVVEIAELEPRPEHRSPEAAAGLDLILVDYQAHRSRCRRRSQSPLVPMGQEMAYRYQERQIEETLAALRRFRAKL